MKKTIYLAGPIAGCNDTQKINWRKTLKELYSDRFIFIDPAIDPADNRSKPSFAIVKKDRMAIRRADAVLANMGHLGDVGAERAWRLLYQ